MTEDIDIEALIADGFLIVRDFIPQERLEALRLTCEASPTAYWCPSDLLASVELCDVLFSRNSMNLALRLLGTKATFLPNFTVRRNARTDWHIDSAFVNDLGGTGNTPRFLQCAVYLQDNSVEYGGGIDAIKGSHRRCLIDGEQYVPAEVIRFPQRTLASKAGDLVIWDARLLHRSTPLPLTDLKANKYGIHWTLASSPDFAKPFLDHMYRRSQSNYDKARKEDTRYSAICNLRFPADYPQSTVSVILGADMQVASFISH